MFSHGKLVSIIQYFTSNVDDYWHILYPDISVKEREADQYLYFYDISRKALDYDGKFSSDGLYLFLGYDGKYHLHALELAQYSLACWLAWQKTKSEGWLNKAITHCEWLVLNQESDGGWRIQHKNPLYTDLPSPWPSGMTQGLAISSLLRAYFFTNDIKFLDTAKKACDYLDVDVSNNGVKRNFVLDGVGGFIYEEYPKAKLSGVLNGYITSILGVYELSLVVPSYCEQLNDNLLNLKQIIPLYDTGFWSNYSLDGNIDSGFYHRYVVKQLKALEVIDIEFEEYRIRFESYQQNILNILKALLIKIRFNL